jgi:signal transduction histidine kinase
LSNAAKYSDKEKWIGVNIRRMSQGVDVVVSDRGIGIDPEDIGQIFEPFFRSKEESARRRKGTGIGLSITKHIMEAHGGMVLVQSRRNIGSSFTLRFPPSLIVSEGEEKNV